MLASLGKDDGGNIDAILHEKQTNFKKKNLFILGEIIAKEPIEKEEKIRRKYERDHRYLINADDISSMSSVESDNDLWDSIESKGYKQFIPGPALKPVSKDSDTISFISEFRTKKTGKGTKEIDKMTDGGEEKAPSEVGTDNRLLIERYERKLDKMRENHKLEVGTISNSLQNKAKEMINAKVEEIKIKFEVDMRALMTQFVEAKALIMEKDKQINQLKELIRQQEANLGGYKRNMERTKSESTKSLFNPDKDDTPSMVFKNQIENLESEVNSLKHMCNMYRRDEQDAQKQLRENIIKMHDMELRHRQEMETTIVDYEEKITQQKEKTAKIYKDFMRYKGNAELEIKILQALTNKYKEGTENMPPIDPNLPRKPSTAFSRDRASKSVIRERRSSISRNISRDSKDNKTPSIISSRRDSITRKDDSSVGIRPDSADESFTNLVSQSHSMGKKKPFKKLDSDSDGYSTYYSRDRSALITPESTKYGSFMTRPGTGAINDKSKASVTFTEQSDL